MKKLLVILVSIFMFLATTPAVAWYVTVQSDDFDGDFVFVATSYTDIYGSTDDPNLTFSDSDVLYVRCKARKLEVFMTGPQDYSRTIGVEAKINSGKAFKWGVLAGTSPDTLFFNNPKTLVTKLLSSSKFTLRVPTTNGSFISIFKTSNLAGAAKSKFARYGCKI